MKALRRILILVVLITLGIGATGYYFYTTPALRSGPRTIYVRTGWNYDSLVVKFEKSGLRYPEVFNKMATQMNLPAHIYPGKYKITGAETMLELIRKFRSAQQEQVTVRIDGEMTEKEALRAIFSQLELDSAELYKVYQNSPEIAALGLREYTRICLFIPDSYFFYWSDSPEKVIARLASEYQSFWDHEKQVRAMDVGLDPVKVSILASIVDGEVIFPEELKTVAGLYLNRLRRNIKLQADPTIKYIINEEGRKRVLLKDLQIENPYNTYLYYGLPPGPIMIPSQKAIQAVLNPGEHNYIFMVAKDDFSGYHEFSRTSSEHEVKARRYRRALDRAGIMH